MALEQPHGIFGKVTTVFATKLKSFTFVPLLKKLPVENKLTPTWKKTLQTSEPNKTSREPGVSEESMTDKGIYKAEIIYIQDHEEGKLGETVKMTTQSEIQSTDYLTLNTPTTPHVESDSITSKSSPATMETIDNKHAGISHLGFHNTSVCAEVSSGLFLNSIFQREEVLSPASSIDFLTSPASSKESILSEGWDKERSWSALHMLSTNGSPVSFSRTVSPCSSIRSGAFTPSVVRIKRHALAPGSSLLQMPSTCGTPCCDSRATSPCPLSPRARHRPPPTQLSLLTAILRKGRLPVLSSALQRPYTPCWPISSVSMSSCLACSAASAVAPMNMPKAKSCSSIDRPCRESCQKSEPQPLKPNHSSLPIASLGNELLPKHSPLTSPNLPTVLAAPAYLSKSGLKDNRLPTVPGPLSCMSFSCIKSLSPKSSHLSCCSSEKTPSGSCDQTASMDPKKYFTSLKLDELNDELKSHNLSDKDSLTIKQEKQLSDPSSEPFLKDIGSSSDYLASSLPKPAQSSCKSSSFSTLKSHESHDNSASPVLSHTMNKPDSLLQNCRKQDFERLHLSSPAFRMSPSSRPVGLTCLSYTPPVSPACPSNQPYFRTSTPEHCTRSPSPAVPSRQLSPSPSYSLCSSPSPSLWGSTQDCTDGKNRKTYRIKSTYKSLAAIPTNTLLLEQQAIDEKVNKEEASLKLADNYAWEDPHSEMCSPAQLRQQSEQLYATIDEVLEDTNLRHQSHHVNKASVKSLAGEAPRPKTSSPSPKLLGRETKYANSHFQTSVPAEKTLTKPGVIKPVIVTSRLTDDKDDEEFHTNPFKSYQWNNSPRYQYKFVSGTLFGESKADGRSAADQQSDGGEGLPSESGDSKTSLASLITQSRSSPQDVPTSICTLETHI